jgi:hypothetical protein
MKKKSQKFYFYWKLNKTRNTKRAFHQIICFSIFFIMQTHYHLLCPFPFCNMIWWKMSLLCYNIYILGKSCSRICLNLDYTNFTTNLLQFFLNCNKLLFISCGQSIMQKPEKLFYAWIFPFDHFELKLIKILKF